MINLWGSTRPTWIRKIQIIQNMAARYVTRDNRYTRVSTLLNKCKWLSVNKMIIFHSLNLLWKTWYREGFTILKEGLIRNHDGTFCEIKGRILLTNDSWKRRTIKIWNKINTTLRMEDNAATFKAGLKDWILENVKIKI